MKGKNLLIVKKWRNLYINLNSSANNVLRYIIILFIFAYSYQGYGQLRINAANTDFVIDFDNSISYVNIDIYDGSGIISSTPLTGELDARAWEISGMNTPPSPGDIDGDGDFDFGDLNTVSNDYGWGTSTGGVDVGGLYAFDISNGGTADWAFGMQPKLFDLSPGAITLRIENQTGLKIYEINIDYDIYEYNDQDRATSLNFSWSYDNANWISVSALDYTSVEVGAGSPSWISTTQSTSVGVAVPDHEYFYLRWDLADVSGSTNWDEFAIDNITVNVSATNQNILLISEIMVFPDIDEVGLDLPDNRGEWFEIYNATSVSIELMGLQIGETNSLETISTLNSIAAGTYMVMGRNDDVLVNGNYTADYEYSSIILSNITGSVEIRSGNGIKIDRIQYNNTNWPYVEGASMVFIGAAHSNNNDYNNWAVSNTREGSYAPGLGTSDVGSPGIQGGASVLSAEIIYFNAVELNGDAILTWSTGDEINTSHFEVEKSTDGAKFSKIASVPATGFSSNKNNYNITDPELQSGEYFYRLKVVDLNGIFEYSNPEFVSFLNNNPIKVYPNPTKDHLVIEINAMDDSEAFIHIMDLSGKMVMMENHSLHEGINHIDMGISGLPSGIYSVILQDIDGVFNGTNYRFVKSH